MWGYKDKAISVRVDSDKYNKIMEYIRKNKYNTYPQLSISR